jgi:hypothetical protein
MTEDRYKFSIPVIRSLPPNEPLMDSSANERYLTTISESYASNQFPRVSDLHHTIIQRNREKSILLGLEIHSGSQIDVTVHQVRPI